MEEKKYIEEYDSKVGKVNIRVRVVNEPNIELLAKTVKIVVDSRRARRRKESGR